MTVKQLSPRWRAVFDRIIDIGRVVDELEFQKSRLADNLLGAFWILNAGKLDQDIFLSFALNNRLADAELIDPVTNRFQRLIDGIVPQRAQLFLVEGQIKLGATRPGLRRLRFGQVSEIAFEYAAHPLSVRRRYFDLELGALRFVPPRRPKRPSRVTHW